MAFRRVLWRPYHCYLLDLRFRVSFVSGGRDPLDLLGRLSPSLPLLGYGLFGLSHFTVSPYLGNLRPLMFQSAPGSVIALSLSTVCYGLCHATVFYSQVSPCPLLRHFLLGTVLGMVYGLC